MGEIKWNKKCSGWDTAANAAVASPPIPTPLSSARRSHAPTLFPLMCCCSTHFSWPLVAASAASNSIHSKVKIVGCTTLWRFNAKGGRRIVLLSASAERLLRMLHFWYLKLILWAVAGKGGFCASRVLHERRGFMGKKNGYYFVV